jgi:hypothetical protein
MKAIALTILIAGCHVALLFVAFATHVFGLTRVIPGWPPFVLGVVIPSICAAIAYYKAVRAFPRFSPTPAAVIASLCTVVSLYVGFFLAVNTFGS